MGHYTKHWHTQTVCVLADVPFHFMIYNLYIYNNVLVFLFLYCSQVESNHSQSQDDGPSFILSTMKENSTKSCKDVYFNIMEIEEMLLFLLKNIFNILKFRDYYALKSKTAELIGRSYSTNILYLNFKSQFQRKPLQLILGTYTQHRERKTKKQSTGMGKCHYRYR